MEHVRPRGGDASFPTHAVSVILAFACLAVGGVIAVYGIAFGILKCLDSCTLISADWSDRVDSWQWDAFKSYSAVLLVALIAFTAGILLKRPLLLALPSFAAQLIMLWLLWGLVDSTGRDDLKRDLAGPAVALGAIGAVSLLLALRRRVRRDDAEPTGTRTTGPPEGVADPEPLEFSAVAIAREAEPVGSLREVREAGLDREDLLGVYRNMLITRAIEERGHILYKQGKIPGSFYTGRGNEAAAVGVATAMSQEDVGTPLHRDMGVHVTRGVEPWRIFAQYMGRKDGPTGGKDGNVHMADSKLGLLAMVSHLPAMLPVAVGCALAFRIREERRVAVGWFGEGAAARGDTHEAMNLAGVRRLPVVFVCDNNQWAYSTPTHLEYPTEHVADRATAYGFEGIVVDGTDVLAVYREAKRAIEKAREGGGPTLIECLTLRMEGHAVHDDAFYVPKELFEEWAKRDPLERFRSWLRENADLSDEDEEEIGADVKKLLNDALRRAEESPLPEPSELLEGVYATAEDLDTPHHK